MSILNAEEAIRFFKSYGFRVDEGSVKEWVKENNKQANTTCKNRPIEEQDLYRYNDWCYVKGTAYEEGIDDKTKISRLLEEVSLLKKEVEYLRDEKHNLENLLGMNDWIFE
ncbi:hypothetical protein [Virgibacillus dakarensis]|uniref:hypothetical protein n=1 Tax=Virgibacillus dakarensis TaxID=1917889 RepID=UPI000B42E782|nr:hypothetical protein [Virgibacillus dakarensis]